MGSLKAEKTQVSVRQAADAFAKTLLSLRPVTGREQMAYKRPLESIVRHMSTRSAEERAVVVEILTLLRPSSYKDSGGKIPRGEELNKSKKYEELRHIAHFRHSRLSPKLFEEMVNGEIWSAACNALNRLETILLNPKMNLLTLQNLNKLLLSTVSRKGWSYTLSPGVVAHMPRAPDLQTLNKALFFFDSVISNKHFHPMSYVPLIHRDKKAFVIDDRLLAEMGAISRLPMGKVLEAVGFIGLEKHAKWVEHMTRLRIRSKLEKISPKKIE